MFNPVQGVPVITTTTPPLEVDGKDILVRPAKYPSTEVKEQLGGSWDRKAKAWRVPPTSLNVHALVSWYGEDILDGAPEGVRDLYFEEWGFPGFSAHPDLESRAHAHPRWGDLYPFQRTAVEYIVCNPHRGALLVLSPGLGKTPVSAVAMDVLDLNKILVLAPLTLARNWKREIETWSDRDHEIVRTTAADKDPAGNITITNFETLYETVLRDEDGETYLETDQIEILEDGEVTDTFNVTNARKVKQWIKDGPYKRDPKKGKQVPVRERIVRARRSYSEIDWDLIIVDESILFKNRKAVKVDVVGELSKYSHNVWLLSGSPTAKYRDDLYPQVRMVFPRAFRSYWRFAEHFCIVDRSGWGWSIEGDRPGVDVTTDLKDFMFVRDQSEVLPDLPEYIYRPLALELNEDQAKAHGTMLDQWVIDLEEEEKVSATIRLAQMTRLQQVTSNMANLSKKSSSVKEDALVTLIENEEIETPLLVWVSYIPTGESMQKRLSSKFKDLSVEFVHGVTSEKAKDARDETLDRFKQGDLDVLILQFEVGKFGHTFTKTKTVYYADRSLNSDSIIQSLRRVRRIGLAHRPVLIIPRCEGTIDDLVEEILEGKMRSIAEVSQADLVELLKSLGRT